MLARISGTEIRSQLSSQVLCYHDWIESPARLFRHDCQVFSDGIRSFGRVITVGRSFGSRLPPSERNMHHFLQSANNRSFCQSGFLFTVGLSGPIKITILSTKEACTIVIRLPVYPAAGHPWRSNKVMQMKMQK